MWHVDERPCRLMFESNVVWYLNARLSGPTSAEQTDFSEKWANAGLDVGGTIILRRMRGSRAYFRIWSAQQRSTDLMSDTLLTAIIEGQIITGYQSDVEHSHASLLWGWGLQQTSIRQCERSAGRGNMLMTVTKPVLWFTFHLLPAFSFVPLHLKRNKAHMMNTVLRSQEKNTTNSGRSVINLLKFSPEMFHASFYQINKDVFIEQCFEVYLKCRFIYCISDSQSSTMYSQ